MNKLNYTEEIFNILSRGGFISNNSVQTKIKRYYDAIEEQQTEYDEYYNGIGFIWKRVMVISFHSQGNEGGFAAQVGSGEQVDRLSHLSEDL